MNAKGCHRVLKFRIPPATGNPDSHSYLDENKGLYGTASIGSAVARLQPADRGLFFGGRGEYLMKMRGKWALFALFGLLFVAAAPNAHAIVELTLTNGATTIDVLDGGALDSCAATDCVTYNGGVGNWTVNVDTGFSGSDPNSLGLAYSGFSSKKVAGALVVTVSNNFYVPATDGFTFHAGGTSTLRSGSNVAFAAFGGTSNNRFDLSNSLAPSMAFTTASYSNDTFGAGVTVSPYSMTIQQTVTCTDCRGLETGSAQLTANASPVPEPAAVTLFGTLLLLTIGAIRRKTRRA